MEQHCSRAGNQLTMIFVFVWRSIIPPPIIRQGNVSLVQMPRRESGTSQATPDSPHPGETKDLDILLISSFPPFHFAHFSQTCSNKSPCFLSLAKKASFLPINVFVPSPANLFHPQFERGNRAPPGPTTTLLTARYVPGDFHPPHQKPFLTYDKPRSGCWHWRPFQVLITLSECHSMWRYGLVRPAGGAINFFLLLENPPMTEDAFSLQLSSSSSLPC